MGLIKSALGSAGSVLFGADTGKDQRIYYFNLKEIIGNKYGTPAPVPFRVVDQNVGLDFDIAIRCNGEYSYKISDPMLFYKNVCGNVASVYTRDQFDSQLKSEFLTALLPAFAQISAMGIRYSALSGYTIEQANAMNKVLQKGAVFCNTNMSPAHMVQAQAEVMKNAASNDIK